MREKIVDEFTTNQHSEDRLESTCKDCNRDKRYKMRYNITTNEFDKAIIEQHNRCLLCGRPFVGIGNCGLAPVQDHCHKTGKNRGIIHRKCNQAIGLFDESPEKLRGAIEYLEGWAA
jgi:ribosomal protein S14